MYASSNSTNQWVSVCLLQLFSSPSLSDWRPLTLLTPDRCAHGGCLSKQIKLCLLKGRSYRLISHVHLPNFHVSPCLFRIIPCWDCYGEPAIRGDSDVNIDDIPREIQWNIAPTLSMDARHEHRRNLRRAFNLDPHWVHLERLVAKQERTGGKWFCPQQSFLNELNGYIKFGSYSFSIFVAWK